MVWKSGPRRMCHCRLLTAVIWHTQADGQLRKVCSWFCDFIRSYLAWWNWINKKILSYLITLKREFRSFQVEFCETILKVRTLILIQTKQLNPNIVCVILEPATICIHICFSFWLSQRSALNSANRLLVLNPYWVCRFLHIFGYLGRLTSLF